MVPVRLRHHGADRRHRRVVVARALLAAVGLAACGGGARPESWEELFNGEEYRLTCAQYEISGHDESLWLPVVLERWSEQVVIPVSETGEIVSAVERSCR